MLTEKEKKLLKTQSERIIMAIQVLNTEVEIKNLEIEAIKELKSRKLSELEIINNTLLKNGECI